MSLSSRKANNHLLKNTVTKAQLTASHDKLDKIQTAIGHTVIDVSNTSTIAATTTFFFPKVDITDSNGKFEFNLAGVIGHADMDFSLEVSQNNIDWFQYPILFTTMGLNVSATFDMVFRYHRIKVTNNDASPNTVNFIQSGRH